jgi:hypothetical protein
MVTITVAPISLFGFGSEKRLQLGSKWFSKLIISFMHFCTPGLDATKKV